MYICISNIQYYFTISKNKFNTKFYMKLTDNTLKEIKKNRRLRTALMDLTNNSEYTILKWLRENSIELLKLNTLQLISAYLKKDIDEIVIKEEHDFKQVV